MKKIQLIAVNAKFMHTNLAVRALRQAVLPYETEMTELTINDQLWHSAEMILRRKSDIYCFSCYIWNMERIRQLAEIIRKSQPECGIYYGGPEVSYDALEILENEPSVDGIFCGEGEKSFRRFVEAVNHDVVLDNIPGLQLRHNTADLQIIKVMDECPFPYAAAELSELKNRILYYESMRGCPFKCAYCLSATLPEGVRCLSLDRVFEELDYFIAAGVRQVKFVDRTFNILKPRAKAILEFLAKKDCRTNFHFEIAADLLDDEMIAMIASAPKGRFQFEAGIQSTYEPTLSAVTRKTDLQLLGRRIRDLMHCGNSHVHVDLIAGLPYENYETFGCSYNDAMALRPDMLQLGFLKLLRGTRIRREAQKHSYLYQSFPPYEVIANDYISSEQLCVLKTIDTLTDLYYNSGHFKTTLGCIFDSGIFESPFGFFEAFSRWWVQKGFDNGAHSRDALYALMYRFAGTAGVAEILGDCLIYDALAGGCKTPPEELPQTGFIRGSEAFEIVKDEALIAAEFPDLLKEPPKQRVKKLRICRFAPAFLFFMHAEGNTAVFGNERVVFTHS